MSYIDVAKQSNFYLLLKDRKHAEFFVQEASLPGFTLADVNVRFNWNLVKHPGDEITWDQLTLTILCDEDLKAWTDIFDLICTLKDPVKNTMELNVPIFDAVLLWTTNKKNIAFEITFHDAWFSSLSALPLTHQTLDDDPITFTADLFYNYYTIKKKEVA